MILYLDTSSLAKLYLEEDYSDLVRDWVEEAEAVATSRIAYPEALSAFVRRWNRGDLTDEEMSLAPGIVRRRMADFRSPPGQ